MCEGECGAFEASHSHWGRTGPAPHAACEVVANQKLKTQKFHRKQSKRGRQYVFCPQTGYPYVSQHGMCHPETSSESAERRICPFKLTILGMCHDLRWCVVLPPQLFRREHGVPGIACFYAKT